MKAKRQAKKAERKSKRAERKYDESMAYNKNLSPEARLHYLENERADKDGASMYGKGPNAVGAAAAAAGGLTLAHIGAATGIAANVLPPLISVGKKVIKGIESLGEGKGFKMKGSEEFKKISQAANNFSKTETGKDIMQKGLDVINKKMGKEKGPNAMGKKEKRGVIGGAIAGIPFGALGVVAGGLAGKAFFKGRDRQEAEGASMMSGKKGPNMKSRKRVAQDYARNAIVDRKEGRTKDANYEQKQATRVAAGESPMMMGNSISKHMGGRGANMYGDGAEMLGMRKIRKENRKDMREHGENLRDIAMTPTRIVSKAANFVSGGDPQTPKEARQERRQERRSARQERKLAKAGGANMKGKKPMMKGGENVIVRDAKSGGKNQYNKRGK